MVLFISVIVCVTAFIFYDDSQIIHGSGYLCGINSCNLSIHSCDLLKIRILCSYCCSLCICRFIVLNGWSRHHLLWIDVNDQNFFWNTRERHLIFFWPHSLFIIELVFLGVSYICSILYKNVSTFLESFERDISHFPLKIVPTCSSADKHNLPFVSSINQQTRLFPTELIFIIDQQANAPFHHW